MKSLFNICISYLAKNLELIEGVEDLPQEVKEWILDFLCSHDLLGTFPARKLLLNPSFSRNLKRISFYLSDEVTDDLLIEIGNCNKQLRQITLIHCNLVSDAGILAITSGQDFLSKLELRGLRNLTSSGLEGRYNTLV